jgi:quinol monooxygenase YgiN
MAIRHLVMWKLWDAADAPRFKAELDSCIDLVPGMLAFNVVMRQHGHEGNVDVLLDAMFADRAALDAYQSHPHHRVVSSRIGPLRETRNILDYEVGTTR